MSLYLYKHNDGEMEFYQKGGEVDVRDLKRGFREN